MTRAPQTPWLEREWRFDLAIGLFPGLVARLEGAPARVAELTRPLSPEQLTRRPEGAWSIQEHLGHLLDLEEIGERRSADYDEGAPVLTAADISNRRTWEAEHNEVELGFLLSGFRVARARLVSWLDEQDERGAARVARHPRLEQPMRVVDWVYFMAEHDDHHIATMRALAAEPGVAPK